MKFLIQLLIKEIPYSFFSYDDPEIPYSCSNKKYLIQFFKWWSKNTLFNFNKEIHFSCFQMMYRKNTSFICKPNMRYTIVHAMVQTLLYSILTQKHLIHVHTKSTLFNFSYDGSQIPYSILTKIPYSIFHWWSKKPYSFFIQKYLLQFLIWWSKKNLIQLRTKKLMQLFMWWSKNT